jgi:hypothetical protein
MRESLWSAVVLALLVRPVEARSRDFSAAPGTEGEEAPLPRSGPVSLSFGLGLNYLYARWREYDPALGTTRFSNDGVWFAEIGLGRATRSGRVDSGPSLSLFGGLMNPDGSSGWGLGTSLLYRWSRY